MFNKNGSVEYQLFFSNPVREEPLMIWVGGLGQKREKKTQRLLAREKNSNQQPWRKTHQPVGQEKKTHQPVGQEKKLNTNSLPEAPPDH